MHFLYFSAHDMTLIEGHSSTDGLVNRTILKPWLALSVCRQYV